MSLARRSITSIAWNSIANWVSHAALFVRGVFLARWLPVDVFGVYALANSVISLSSIVAHFGMAHAFLYRAPETENEDQAAAVYFTLKLISALILVTLLSLGAFIFTDDSLRTALLLLTATAGASQLSIVPAQVLARRIVYRRLALLKLTQAALTSLAVLGLAWQGATLWALLSINIFNTLLAILVLYIWRPVWRPRLAWSPRVARYFLSFGSRAFWADLLYRALDHVDDLWVGSYLGETSLGFYSKAYSFATYPYKVLAGPVSTVAIGTYAELKAKRQQLSQAFFRVNALLVRSGFFMGGLLALIAPEFIRIVLGEKWLPMLNAFRLMLVFTLLDPIKMTTGYLFVAVGKPERLVRIRLTQLAVMVAGLYLLGPRWGIAGVALAVDGMLVFGIGLLLWHAQEYVDLSIRTLFLTPLLALIVGLFLSRSVLSLPGVLGADWRTASVKFVVFSTLYAGMLVLLERHQICKMVKSLSWFRGTLLPFGEENYMDLDAIGTHIMRVKRILISKARHRWEVWQWERNGKPVPPPHLIKERIVKQYAERFSVDTLVETGTYRGRMVFATRNSFRCIFSIELDQVLCEQAQIRFALMPQITILQGDSSQVLPELLSKINTPCLFWLDAHHSGGDTARGALETPVVQEVKSILNHPVEGHVILIDDARYFVGENDYPTLDELEAVISDIHPDWVFEVEEDIIRIHKGNS